ncbi:unnamed protein product [Penicillium glandicola]
MASRMDVDSSNPNHRKRLSGPFPTKTQDPRLAGFKPPPKLLSPGAPLSIPNSPSGPQPTESQGAPSHQDAPSNQGALFISDLVNSLIKVNKAEDEKEKLQKEIVSITKNLQRARQSQQFPSVIALFQQQLDAAKDELTNNVKSIVKHRSLSNQAQDSFSSALLQSKSHPQLEKIPERVEKLEITMKEMGKGRGPTASDDNPMKGNPEIERVQTDMQGLDRDIAELKAKLEEVQCALENPNGLLEALEYMKRIANSVSLQSKQNNQFTTKISSLEDEVKAADKKLDDKISIVRKMVDAVEEELKNSNQQLESNISDLGCRLRTTNEQLEGNLRSIERDLQSLNTKRHGLNNSVSTQVSQIETDLEAQRRQATEQIAAQENLVASLRTQQQKIDNGGRLPSEETPTSHGGVLQRVASLEKKVQTHTDLLNNIKKLHQEVDVMRLSELGTLRDNHETSQRLLESRQRETLQKVEELTTKSSEVTGTQTALATALQQLRTSLATNLEQLQINLQSRLDGFETHITPISDFTQAIKNCEGKIGSANVAIRSLEQRWTNIHTTELVNSMAHAMQEMYPSVGQLSQQLTAYRTEIEARISALKTDADAFKAATETFKADTNRFKADTEKAQADAQTAQASTTQSQAALVLPEQLQNLTQLPNLLQQVKDLSDKLGPVEALLEEHSNELQKNLELRSELQNRIAAQDDTIGGVVDDQVVGFETITEFTRQKVIEEVNAHISQLEEARRNINQTNQDAGERNPTTVNDLDGVQGLEDRETVDDKALETLRKRLKELEDRNKTEDAGLKGLQEQLKALEDRKPPVSPEEFIELRDEVKMYVKRLRNAEDTFKALGVGVKDFEAKDSDALDTPIEQRIDGHETPLSQLNSRASTPRPASTPKTVPMGPTLGVYQPVQPDGKGQDDNSTPSVSKSNYSVMQARQSSQTPSRPSPYAGKSAEPRQVQNLKGKRRMSSVIDSDEERNATESSSAIESSLVPSSSASSPFGHGSSRKDKKKAKKRAEQAGEKPNVSSKQSKKRKRVKQDP